jgi:hypothetical protein
VSVQSFEDLCRVLDLKRPSAVRRVLKARKIRFSEDSKGRPWTTEAEMDRALSASAMKAKFTRPSRPASGKSTARGTSSRATGAASYAE